MKKEEIIKAQLVIVIGFLILYFFTEKPILMYISLGLGLLFLILPSIGELIINYWFKFGGVLGKINGTILLSVIYVFVLVPTALIKRVVSGNTISNKPPKQSNFKERNRTYTPRDLKYGW